MVQYVCVVNCSALSYSLMKILENVTMDHTQINPIKYHLVQQNWVKTDILLTAYFSPNSHFTDEYEDPIPHEFPLPPVHKLVQNPPACQTQKETMDPAYMLVVALVSAIAGAIMSVSVYHSWSKSKRAHVDAAAAQDDDDEYDEDEFEEGEGEESEEGEGGDDFDRYSDCEYYEMHNGQVRRDGIPIETELKDIR